MSTEDPEKLRGLAAFDLLAGCCSAESAGYIACARSHALPPKGELHFADEITQVG